MDYLKGYEAYLTTEKKASENTLSSYLRDVRQFSEYCQRETLELTETIRQIFNEPRKVGIHRY